MVAACGAGDESNGPDNSTEMVADGAEGGACYGNNTCDEGLVCASKHCVKLDDMGTGGEPATGGAGGEPATGDGGSLPTATGGGGGDPASTGGAAGTPGSGGAPGDEPVCTTVDVTNAAAGEKTNAAFCFGLAFDDDYGCTFDSANNATVCVGTTTAFVVLWVGNDYGNVYNPDTDELIGQITQGGTGAFEMTFGDVAVGACTVNGDVATLCVVETT
jgi:hypothetical protein